MTCCPRPSRQAHAGRGRAPRDAGSRPARRAPAADVARVARTVAALALVAFASVATAAPATPPHLELVIEVSSYGERPRDLTALLVPLFARLQFSQLQKAPALAGWEGSATFTRADADFVIAAGRYNCIVVAYYAGRPGKGTGGAWPKDRAGTFAAALLDFLDGLPTPRPQAREVVWGSKYCAAAAPAG
jgi:hypothetical protein